MRYRTLKRVVKVQDINMKGLLLQGPVITSGLHKRTWLPIKDIHVSQGKLQALILAIKAPGQVRRKWCRQVFNEA